MKLRPITRHLVAGAVLLAIPMWTQAAGLGKLVVNSALGQPLSAEIDLIAADKAELDSISASLASAQAFQDAKIDYAPALSNLHFAVEKKSSGRAVLKVTSTRPVNDPFLDMLVELNWASGRLVREYTVLLDPPGMVAPQTAAPVAVAAPVATAPAAEAKPAAPSPAPAEPATPIPSKAAAAPAPAKKAAAKAVQAPAPAAKAEPSTSAEGTIKVKRGDTLNKIARQIKPEGLTLEQTLVGLFQANTNAFEGKNMNRLKAGSKLKVPPADEMALVTAQKARQEIQLQSSDWQAYRQKLAGGVVKAPEMPAKKEQAASGKITTKVEDKAQPKPGEAKDVLKLSKPVTPPASTVTASPKAETAQKQAMANAKAEDEAAKAKAQKEASERAAKLEKQIQDMQKLVDEKTKKQETEKAAAAAALAKAEKPKKKPAPAPEVASTTQSTSWMDTLRDNPLYWLGGSAVVLLGGALWWMMAGTRRKKTVSTFDDSIMTGGDLKTNTVMGVAAGGAVNTGDTSFLTDFSQAGMGNIDTHDVDPIAEAEVYMAYGRDAQAEEILKEALNKTPDRQEVRVKLLEIYAARKNVEAFEKVARELHVALNDEESPLWQKAAEMGRTLDPSNPLYGGKPAAAEEQAKEADEPIAAAPAITAAAAAAPAAGLAALIAAETASPEASTFESAGQVLDFDSHMDTISGNVEIPEDEASEVANTLADLNFDMSGVDIKPDTAEKPQDLDMDLGAAEDDNKLDFSSLDLNLDSTMPDEDMDEVTTKLDLARAYLEMGDKEGAREILQEVVTEGNSNQQASARTMLGTL